MSGRAGLKSVIVMAVTTIALSLVVASPAAAALQRLNTTSFGSDGTSATSFPNEIMSAAFDQTNKQLYMDQVLLGTRGWNASTPGTYTPLPAPFPLSNSSLGGASETVGLAVDNTGLATNGRLYQVQKSGGQLNAFTSTGVALGAPFPIVVTSPGNPCGVAVDSAGNIFLGNEHFAANAAGRGIVRYTSSGTALPSINTSAHEDLPCRLAIDGNDNLYVATEETATNRVWKYTAASNYTTSTLFDPTTAKGLAVNKTTGHVFVAHQEVIFEYDTAGNLIREFGNEFGSSATRRFYGIAVNEATDEVYVIDNDSTAAKRKIRVYGPPVVVRPEVTTGPPSGVTRSTATATGLVDPAGGSEVTDCKVEWGLTAKYGSVASCLPTASPGTPYTTATSITAELSGLTLATTYHYRVTATNSERTNVGRDEAFTTVSAVRGVNTGAASPIGRTTATLNGSFEAEGINTTYYFQYGTTKSYGSFAPVPPPGEAGGNAGGITTVSAPVSGLTHGTSYNYRLVGVNSFGTTLGANQTFTTQPAVKGVITEPATNVKATSFTLNGVFDPDGISTKYYFEYGLTTSYGSFAPVGPPGEIGGESAGSKAVSANISGLESGRTYNFRLAASNVFGTSFGANQTVTANEVPTIKSDTVSSVNTDGAVQKALINPNSLATTYHFEYGTEDCSVIVCTSGPSISIGSGKVDVAVSLARTALSPGTTYHFRVVATNSRGTTTGADRVFKTFAVASGDDTCPNALQRKQTGASLLLDCRSYELASASDQAGHDVESDLFPGQTPLDAYPRAQGKLLYTVHGGAIPGTGNPTNRGADPYVAIRGEGGWTTRYVGIPADGTPSTTPFSSALLGADANLSTFAFGGAGICSPCFDDGSTNVPLRLPDGSLVQGMVGSESPMVVNSAGQVNQPLSADGSHFVFGSTVKLEPSANSGSVSIYSRDLGTHTSEVVSTMPNGSTMTGLGIAELAISSNGSRVLIGKLVSTDAAGNQYFDLYMHVAGMANSILVADTTNGVIFNGMDGGGTKVFFTTPDPLDTDTDASPDLFRADVGAVSATVARVSSGIEGTGNVNACDPVANTDGNNWNAVGVASANNCGTVAIAGGGGVAEESGAVFLLSPEKLDGSANGTLNQPNLYVVQPGGVPDFVATLEPNNQLIRNAVKDSEKRNTADFQIARDGNFAVLATSIALTGADVQGHSEIYRYSSTGPLTCPSCAPTNAGATTETTLASHGLNLSDDGRVFFTSTEQLVLRDTNGLKDAYEWEEGRTELISTGLSTSDAGLVSVTADGTDAFFYTRQTITADDHNGGAMKIYDARAGGGFLYNPPPHPCAASDECHGPSSQAAPSPPINTGSGTGLPQRPPAATVNCKRHFVKRHGVCVKRHTKRKGRRHA